jgi:hypothetical protein
MKKPNAEAEKNVVIDLNDILTKGGGHGRLPFYRCRENILS